MKEKKNIIKGKYMNFIAHIAVKSKAACHLRDWNFALHLSGHQKSYVKVILSKYASRIIEFTQHIIVNKFRPSSTLTKLNQNSDYILSYIPCH